MPSLFDIQCWGWPSLLVCPGQALAVYSVDEVHNGVVLLDARTIEMLAHRQCQLLFALPPVLPSAGHCRRVEADAARL